MREPIYDTTGAIAVANKLGAQLPRSRPIPTDAMKAARVLMGYVATVALEADLDVRTERPDSWLIGRGSKEVCVTFREARTKDTDDPTVRLHLMRTEAHRSGERDGGVEYRPRVGRFASTLEHKGQAPCAPEVVMQGISDLLTAWGDASVA